MPPAHALESEPPLRSRLVLATSICAVVAVAWIVVIAVAMARERVDLLVFQPINGTFQTFDPVRRMLAGEWPGRDFDVYLGLGPVYATRLSMLACGDTYRDSVVATVVATALLQALLPAVLARLLGWRIGTSVAVGWIAFLFALAPLGAHLDPALLAWITAKTSEVASPGYSLLAFRCVAPFLAIGLVALAWRAGRFARPGRWLESSVVIGVAAGACAPWSNDYGATTAIALIGTFVLLSPAEVLAGRRASACGVAVLCAALASLAVVALATGGAPLAWLDYNWNGVARDQGWYFTAGAGRRSPPPLDVPWIVFGAATTVAAWIVAWRTRALGDAAVVVVLTACALAGILAASAQPLDRYFLPLERAAVVVAPLLALREIAAWRRARAGHAAERRLAAWSALALYVAGVPAAVIASRAYAQTDPAEARVVARGIDVPELGGRLPAANHKSVELARWIRADAERRGLPADRRVFSTYSTLIDVVAEAFQPTRADYVIHALGHARRADYVRTLEQNPPAYATTIRADYTEWEGWVRRQNWETYARLLDLYEPWERTPYAIVWRHTGRGLPAPDVPVTLERTAGSGPHEVHLRLSIDTAHAAGGAVIVEVALTSAAGFLHAPGALAPRGSVLRGVEIGRVGKDSDFALPCDGTQWRFPVEVTPGTPVEILLASPEGTPIRLDSVAARARVRKDALDGFRLKRLLPAAENQDGYTHGIRANGDAGEFVAAEFVVADRSDLRGLAPGARLSFAGSGERRVLAIDGRRVHVDGAALDPLRDGVPNWIEILEFEGTPVPR